MTDGFKLKRRFVSGWPVAEVTWQSTDADGWLLNNLIKTASAFVALVDESFRNAD